MERDALFILSRGGTNRLILAQGSAEKKGKSRVFALRTWNVPRSIVVGMKIAFFDTHRFEREPFQTANAKHGHSITFLEPRLTAATASLARGYPAVCAFVNDKVDRETQTILKEGGTRLIALRSAGFNHVDLAAADALGLDVVRVPEYSPYAVAEHAVCLLLALNRKIHRAYSRVRELNFSLDGLVGFDLHGKTVGLIGTGKIGTVMARILHGFGCRLLLFDRQPQQDLARELGARYVDLPTLYRESDVISLHVPLTPETRYLINEKALNAMKPGVILLNTGRGALVETRALIAKLKTGHVGGAGLDVYEEEESIFFQNLSDSGLQDDVLARLLTFPNVLITAHQAFLTHEALGNIASTTLESITAFERGEPLRHRVSVERISGPKP
jgi:D-lactate dehydrogenase